MKPDKLETFIKAHKTEFDSFEPSEQLWNQIEIKLETKIPSRRNSYTWIWKAAIIMGIVITTVAITNYFSKTANEFAFTIQNNDNSTINKHQIKELKNIIRDNNLQAQLKKREVENKKGKIKEAQINIAENTPINPVLEETNKYYSIQIQQKQQEIFKFTSNNPEIRKEIQVEFSQLDKAFNELKNDLKNNVNNEEVIDAMIQNYRIKLEMLESILNQLKSNKNDTKDENKPKYAI